MTSQIRKDFDKDFEETFKPMTKDVKSGMAYGVALWAAQWMAERFAKYLEESKGLNHYKQDRKIITEASFQIRQLSKDLTQ